MTPHPLAILCVPCLCVGGTEMHTLELARTLVSGGWRVQVVAYHEHHSEMVREFKACGCRVTLLNLDRDAKRRNVGMMPRLAMKLFCLFRRERPTVVHVQYMAPGVVPIVAARMALIPTVFATVHVPGWTYRRLWVPRLCARLCTAFLHVSLTAEESFWGTSRLIEAGNKGPKHGTIHNPADLETIDRIRAAGARARVREQLGLASDALVFGVVARVSSEKGQRWLLEAAPGVFLRHPSAHLIVVGDGADRAMLEARTEAMGLADRISWVGRLPREEAWAHFDAMDVAVVPSQWEGFGLSAAEAMAFHRPVVATDVGGLREVVTDGVTGRLVPWNDSGKLCDAIAALLGNAPLREEWGAAGRARVEEMFSLERFRESHLALYNASLVPRAVRALRISTLIAKGVSHE